MAKVDQNKVRYMDLLWRYYEKNRSFSSAARVLSKLADMHRYGLIFSLWWVIDNWTISSYCTQTLIFKFKILRKLYSGYTYIEFLWVYLDLPKVKVLVAQSCLIVCDSMDCSPPGSSVHGDSPGENTGGVAMPFSRGPSWPRDWT